MIYINEEQTNTGKMTWAAVGVILLILVIGYFLWNRDSSTPANTQTSPDNSSVSNQKETTVLGSEFSFEPSDITIKSGEKVKLTFKNIGKAPHDLTISELGVATKTINEGQSDTIEFIAPNSGTFSFICSVGNHAAKGMTGTIKAE